MKKKPKGLTIIELMISFSVAFILIISLYAIVYWGLKVSDINQYYIEVNNILIFLSNEIQNNPNLYIEYNQTNFSFTHNAKEQLLSKLYLYNYKIKNEENYDIILGKIRKLPDQNLQRILEIEVSVIWYYKGKKYTTTTSLLIPVYTLENATNNIPLPENSDI